MHTISKIIVALALVASVVAASAQQTEKRIALVIGNAAYQTVPLPTPANDAGLIAQTLQAAGFDVVGARDLDQDTLRRTFRDFLDKASASGPNTVAFVYLSGYGLQLEGENYFVPVDARLARDTDISVEAVRMSDYTRPLAALKLKAKIIVLDAARAHPFAKSGEPLASGLSLVDPDKGMLIAFNAAPGTVGPQEKGPYSAYAQALAEMIRTGGVPVGDVFNRVRLRVNEVTKGGEVPWNASKIDAPIVFFERSPDAPPPAVSNDQVSSIRSKPIRDFDAQDAYVAALERDTLQGYLDFLTAYPADPMAKRVRAIVAARREAITWRRTRALNTPQAYWSYLRRYPRGPHMADARRRLAFLSAAFEPPRSFTVITYDVPPPPEEEIIYFRRPVLYFDDPEYGFAPPPPAPVFFLAPPPPEFVVLAPPPPAFGIFVLPVPDYVPVPTYYNAPAYVAAPPPNVIYNNVHNTVVINNTSNSVTITNPSGQTQTVTPAQAVAPQSAPVANAPAPAPAPAASQAGQTATPATSTSPSPTAPARTISPGVATAVGAAAGAALLAPSLPPSVARKAAVIQTQNPPGASPSSAPAALAKPGSAGSSTSPQPAATQPGDDKKPGPTAAPLPGAGGQPLPQINGKPPVPTQAQTPAAPVVAPIQSGQPARPIPPDNKPAAQTLPGSNGQPLPPIDGKPVAPGPNQSTAPSGVSPSSSPAKTETPPPAGARPASQPPIAQPPAATTRQATPPAAANPPPATSAPSQPEPPAAARPAPPPPAAARPAPPPPAAARPAPPPPPPPAAARPAPPPPPPAAAHPAPPPPPPPAAARPAPPPPPPASPPPAAARPAPPAVAPPAAAAKKPCVLPNGAACPEKK